LKGKVGFKSKSWVLTMAGHSKWANIKFRKMGQDAKRGKLFTKYIREITVAARQGGGDVQSNPRLRTVIDKALSANMTRDTIDRAIKRGVGNDKDDLMEEIRYEGYGPGGVAIIIDCMTDNRKRTVSDVRHLLTKCGGNLGTDGSVAYLFAEKGQIVFAPGVREEAVMNIALECDAEDIQTDADGTIVVTTSFEDFSKVKQAMEKGNLKPERAEMSLIPSSYIAIEDKEVAEKLIRLVDSLEDLDDVQLVHSNADIAEELLQDLA
jgi:YebC/PmpR family DNA-binding regulatory protein